MLKQRFKARLYYLLEKQQCPYLLSRSFAMGTYIAFSPFMGLHTLMVFVISWVLSLEYTAVFAAAWLINNPWTMVPVYAIGYNTGNFLLTTVCGLNAAFYNPSWIQPTTMWLGNILGISNLSFWSFMIGGNIVGICAALLMYPLVKPIFEQLVREKNMKQKDL